MSCQSPSFVDDAPTPTVVPATRSTQANTDDRGGSPLAPTLLPLPLLPLWPAWEALHWRCR